MNAGPETEKPLSSHAPDPAPPPSGSALPYVLSIAVVLVMVYGAWTWWKVEQYENTRGQAVPTGVSGPPITEFELTERSGKPFRSADMRGRVWVASYFFTSCNGQCRRLNANLQVLSSEPDLKDVVWVSITCDPDNDSLEALRTYADLYKADPNRWLFCRGDLDYTIRVALGMKVYLSYKDHQDRVIVFDKAGNMRGYFDATSTLDCERMRKLLVECLHEKPPSDVAASRPLNGKSS
jgi:cytochrome oxidase Cu insertion factor (SCO1/SenC/PrrC family)